MAVEMQVAPSLDKLDCFSDGSLLASAFLSFGAAVVVQAGIETIAVGAKGLPAFVANENDSGLEVLFMDEAVVCADLAEGGEGVGVGVVNGDAMQFWGAVSLEQIIQVNIIVGEVQLAIDDQGLLGFFALENEGFGLWF